METRSEQMLAVGKNGANRLAGHRVTTNLQVVKHTIKQGAIKWVCLDSHHGGLLRAGHARESGVQEEGGPQGGTPRHLPVFSEWWGPPGLCLCRLCMLSHEQWLRVCHQKTGELSLAGWALQNPGKRCSGFQDRRKRAWVPVQVGGSTFSC